MTDGFKVTKETQKPRAKVASDQKSFGTDTVGNVATFRHGPIFSDSPNLRIRVGRKTAFFFDLIGLWTPRANPCRNPDR